MISEGRQTSCRPGSGQLAKRTFGTFAYGGEGCWLNGLLSGQLIFLMSQESVCDVSGLKEIYPSDDCLFTGQCSPIKFPVGAYGCGKVRLDHCNSTGMPSVSRGFTLHIFDTANGGSQKFGGSDACSGGVLPSFLSIFGTDMTSILMVEVLGQKQTAECEHSTDRLNPSGQAGVSVCVFHYGRQIDAPRDQQKHRRPRHPTYKTSQDFHRADAATLEAA